MAVFIPANSDSEYAQTSEQAQQHYENRVRNLFRMQTSPMRLRPSPSRRHMPAATETVAQDPALRGDETYFATIGGSGEEQRETGAPRTTASRKHENGKVVKEVLEAIIEDALDHAVGAQAVRGTVNGVKSDKLKSTTVISDTLHPPADETATVGARKPDRMKPATEAVGPDIAGGLGAIPSLQADDQTPCPIRPPIQPDPIRPVIQPDPTLEEAAPSPLERPPRQDTIDVDIDDSTQYCQAAQKEYPSPLATQSVPSRLQEHVTGEEGGNERDGPCSRLDAPQQRLCYMCYTVPCQISCLTIFVRARGQIMRDMAVTAGCARQCAETQ